MSDPFIKEAKKSSLLVKVILGTVAVAAVAALGLIGYKFISYKETGGMPADLSSAQVAISYPLQGAQLELSDSVMVEAAAIGSIPFLSMELWINGELEGVQAAPSGGAYPFSTFFSWRPSEPGTYSLIAAAIDADDNKEISAQVVVFVVQTETGIELSSSDSPSVLPAASAGGYYPPAPPSPDESKGLTGIWTGSAGDWVTSLMAEVKPKAPELYATAGECGALLQFHDLSDNEEGFAVYRQAGISPMWVKIATLSSQSNLDWITYTDEGIYGAVNYYVSAFNSQGESISNFVLVSIDPKDCSVESDEIAVGTLEMNLQVQNQSGENVYCYQSTDGIHWNRWPVFGFLQPGGGASGGLMYDIGGGDQEGQDDTRVGGPIMQFMLYDLAGEIVIPKMDIFMECWAWEDGELQYAGKLEAKGISPQENSNLGIIGEGIIAELAFDIFKTSGHGDNYWEVEDRKEPIQIGVIDSINFQIPRVILSVTTDRNICGKYLPPYVQSLDEQNQFCFLYPEYDPVINGGVEQPYLIWEFDPEPICLGGTSEGCKTYKELLDLAKENGGQVGFTIISKRGEIKKVWNVTEPELRTFVVPPLPCLGDSVFSVRMWYRPGNKGVALSTSPDDQISEVGEFKISTQKTYYGPYSNWVTIPCYSLNLPNASIIEMVQYYDVTFESFDLDWVDDDDIGVEMVEVYGYFKVVAPSMGQLEEGPCVFNGWDSCFDDEPDYMTIYTKRYLLINDWGEPGKQFTDGHYGLYDEKLCQSTRKSFCRNEGQYTSYKFDNNTLRIFAKEDDAITLDVMLVDHDESSDHDIVCSIFPKMVWPSSIYPHDSQYYLLMGDYFEGYNAMCTVGVTITRVGDPVPLYNP